MKQTHFSLWHRFLHWMIALGILLALFTAFLHATWMNGNEMATAIISSLAEKGITLPYDEARLMARTISGPMFHWHFYAGYALIPLLVLRCIDLLAGGLKFTSPFLSEATLEQKFRGGLYLLLYIALAVILIMGLLLKFGPRNDLHEVFRIAHVCCGYFAGMFVLIHFAGLLIGEHTTDKGIVSKMINGGE
jgi:cytochrome b561